MMMIIFFVLFENPMNTRVARTIETRAENNHDLCILATFCSHQY